MQNGILSNAVGKIKAVHFKAGETVSEDDVLVELE